MRVYHGVVCLGQAGVGREKFVRRFIEEAEPGLPYIIAIEGWKQTSEDSRGRVIIDRVVLREVVCQSWDEEATSSYITWIRGRVLRVCRRTYSESIGAIGPSERKNILMVTRELPREELDRL
jgi:hypothetical protein